MREISGLADTQLKKVFYKIADVMQKANLEIIDNNHVETMEVHLKDTEYNKYAFASIQCSSGKYVELRFPRRHLQRMGMIDAINDLGGDTWRNDSKDFIRFRFDKLTENSIQFLENISDYLKFTLDTKKL